MPTPAYRIETERLVLRCWEPADAPQLKAAVDANLEHLRPWMPWAWHAPSPLEEVVNRLRSFRAEFDRDENYTYGLFDAETSQVVGSSGLHRRDGGHSLEIGYWIDHRREGEGLVTEACAAQTRFGLEGLVAPRIEIRCDPVNLRSMRVPERLGYRLEGTLRAQELTVEEKLRDTAVWAMLASDLPESRARLTPYRAFDAIGQQLI